MGENEVNDDLGSSPKSGSNSGDDSGTGSDSNE